MSYSTRETLEMVFGKQNILRWADIDNDKDEALIASRITFACDTADAYLNDRIRLGQYAVPFDDPVPQTVIFMSTLYAGTVLYDARQITAREDNRSDQLSWHRKHFNTLLNQYLRGQMRFDGLEIRASIVPSVATEEE